MMATSPREIRRAGFAPKKHSGGQFERRLAGGLRRVAAAAGVCASGGAETDGTTDLGTCRWFATVASYSVVRRIRISLLSAFTRVWSVSGGSTCIARAGSCRENLDLVIDTSDVGRSPPRRAGPVSGVPAQREAAGHALPQSAGPRASPQRRFETETETETETVPPRSLQGPAIESVDYVTSARNPPALTSYVAQRFLLPLHLARKHVYC